MTDDYVCLKSKSLKLLAVKGITFPQRDGTPTVLG
jgi:hypothetical protein